MCSHAQIVSNDGCDTSLASNWARRESERRENRHFDTTIVKPTLLDGFAQALSRVKVEDALHFFSDQTTRICQVRIHVFYMIQRVSSSYYIYIPIWWCQPTLTEHVTLRHGMTLSGGRHCRPTSAASCFPARTSMINATTKTLGYVHHMNISIWYCQRHGMHRCIIVQLSTYFYNNGYA